MLKSRDFWCKFWKFVTFTLFGIKFSEKSLSFDCVPLLLQNLLAKTLSLVENTPTVLIGLNKNKNVHVPNFSRPLVRKITAAIPLTDQITCPNGIKRKSEILETQSERVPELWLPVWWCGPKSPPPPTPPWAIGLISVDVDRIFCQIGKKSVVGKFFKS